MVNPRFKKSGEDYNVSINGHISGTIEKMAPGIWYFIPMERHAFDGKYLARVSKKLDELNGRK